VILDTETTSLRRDRRVWEVAMIRIDEYGEREIAALVSDVDLSEADPKSLDIGRFYDRHPLYGNGTAGGNVHLEEESAVASLVEYRTRGAVIVGAVPNFDTEVLSDMLYRHKLCPSWHYHLVDVETLVVGWLAAQSNVDRFNEGFGDDLFDLPWDSNALSRAVRVDPAQFDRHTALGDCRWVLAQLRVVAPELLAQAQSGGAR
jgi:hypothetical protein